MVPAVLWVHSGALTAATATLLAASIVSALPVNAQTLESAPGAPPTVVSAPTPSASSGGAIVDQAVGTVIDVVKVPHASPAVS